MARPLIPSIQAGQAGWDALLNDIVAALTARPMPVVEVADLATLTASFPANQFDRCIAATADTSTVYISDGATWTPV